MLSSLKVGIGMAKAWANYSGLCLSEGGHGGNSLGAIEGIETRAWDQPEDAQGREFGVSCELSRHNAYLAECGGGSMSIMFLHFSNIPITSFAPWLGLSKDALVKWGLDGF
ncbi:uncharacterized protein G2W53_013816 [Senna tora]|uniref:Uncharacterized protein n=1 Tax=Senna tora TaxID=362788 RepID=A0A834WRF3_9FABA|nr:uncharacterized protein G2W53_013816 [Senna tora]